MKEEMVETFEKINEKRKLPQEIIEKIIKEVNNNFLMSIAIMLYFILLIMGSIDTTKNVRQIDFNIFSILLLAISIFFFEYGYKKDSGKITLYGVETLVAAIVTLFLPYIVFELNSPQRQYYFMIGAYFAVYYIIKTIFVCINENKRYREENISNDIKDIIKKEERNYETHKTVVEDIDEEDIIEEKEIIKKEIKEKPKSKRGRAKKVFDKKEEKSEKIKSKRGRPKKVITEELKPVIDETKTIVTDKAEVKRGRGRPRKVVS